MTQAIGFVAATDLQTSSSCPMPLRLLACMLLFEITAYLRETFQNLPKSIRVVGRERATTVWEKSYMKEANRRFSIALSSMGHSQASAQSLQSISCDREPSKCEYAQNATRVKPPTCRSRYLLYLDLPKYH